MNQIYPPYQSPLNNIPQIYQPQIPQQNTQPIQYVSNKQSAEAYNVQPNQSVLLMNSNEPIFYIKQADASGFCTIKSFKFEEIDDTQPQVTNYVTKDEFNTFKDEFDKLRKELCE